MPFTIEQRSKIVKFSLETKSLVQTQREYRKHFGVKVAPSVTSIKCMAPATTEIKEILEGECLLAPN